MSRLREQLQQARSEYQSIRYPGDLVSEVMPLSSARRWILTGAIAAAVIAALIVSIVMRKTSNEPMVAINNPDIENTDEGVTLSVAEVPSWAEVTVEALAPGYQSLTLATIPSLSTSESEEDQ